MAYLDRVQMVKPDVAKALRILGLARRANAVQFGAEACEKATKQGRSKLLLIASNAGDSTKKRFAKLAEDKQVSTYQAFTALQIKEAIGRDNVVVLSVSGEHFANEIRRLLELNTDKPVENVEK